MLLITPLHSFAELEEEHREQSKDSHMTRSVDVDDGFVGRRNWEDHLLICFLLSLFRVILEADHNVSEQKR